MMADARLFVSHSHHDNAFGLRLITDLRARLGDDAVWFDASGGLQGGDEWWRTIVKEILARDYFLVILSPEALASPWVRKEMDLAYNQHVSRGKRLLPLLYHPCEPSADWQLIQSIAIADPAQDAAAYERGLTNVLKQIDPQLGSVPPRPTYSQEQLYALYKQGLEAKNRQQWEACADAWRKVLAADPKYLGGSLANDMVEVEREVATLNIQRLRQAVQQAKAGGQSSEIVQALYGLTLADPSDEAARKDLWASGVTKADGEHQHGVWNDEIATWDLLLRVLPTYNYASRRKAIAEQNQQYVQMYRLACDLAREGKKAEAAEQLTRLWQRDRAPYYGDPSGIAPILGLQLPPTYDVVAAEQEQKRKDLEGLFESTKKELAQLDRSRPIKGNWKTQGGLIGSAIGLTVTVALYSVFRPEAYPDSWLGFHISYPYSPGDNWYILYLVAHGIIEYFSYLLPTIIFIILGYQWGKRQQARWEKAYRSLEDENRKLANELTDVIP